MRSVTRTPLPPQPATTLQPRHVLHSRQEPSSAHSSSDDGHGSMARERTRYTQASCCDQQRRGPDACALRAFWWNRQEPERADHEDRRERSDGQGLQ